MRLLSEQYILGLHSATIRESGGCDGVRDEDLLRSAIAAPFQEFDGVEVYPSIQQKAARLAYGIVKNHAFIDGNKRTGAHAMLVFLQLNNVVLRYSQSELSDLFLAVADGSADFEQLLLWILNHQL